MGRKERVYTTGAPWPLAGRSCLQAAKGNPEALEEESRAGRLGFLPGNPPPCGWHRAASVDLLLGTWPPAMTGRELVGVWHCVVSRVSYGEEGRAKALTR